MTVPPDFQTRTERFPNVMIDRALWRKHAVVGAFAFPLATMFLGPHLVHLIQMLPDRPFLVDILPIAFLLFFALQSFTFIPIYMSSLLVTTSDIELTVQGVKLEVLGPLQVSIPWESFRDAQITPVRYQPFARSRSRKTWVVTLRPWGIRWGPPKETAYAISVPGLTIFHLLAGIYYRLRPTPVFIVTQDHLDHKRLLEKLKEAATSQGHNMSPDS